MKGGVISEVKESIIAREKDRVLDMKERDRKLTKEKQKILM